MKRVSKWGFLWNSTSVTSKLILINVVFFVLALIVSLFFPNLFDYLALKPSDFVQGKNLWTILTSMFMHAGFFHLLFNMFSLWFVGRFVESIIGRKRFLVFYLLAGIIAGLFFSLLAAFFGYGIFERVFGNPGVAGVGASGAIFGLIGLLAVLTPRNRVYLIAGPLIAIIIQVIIEAVFPNQAFLSVISLIVSIYIFISIFSLFSMNPRSRRYSIPLEMPFWMLPFIAIVPLIIIGLFFPLPIGNTAHLGGLIAGLVYGFYLRRKYKNKVRLLDRMYK